MPQVSVFSPANKSFIQKFFTSREPIQWEKEIQDLSAEELQRHYLPVRGEYECGYMLRQYAVWLNVFNSQGFRVLPLPLQEELLHQQNPQSKQELKSLPSFMRQKRYEKIGDVQENAHSIKVQF